MTTSRKLIVWFLASCLLSLPLVLQIRAANAQSQKLTIKTIDTSAGAGEPPGVRATITIRSLKLPEQPFVEIDASGVFETEPFPCEPGMNFRAEPKSKMIYVDTGELKPCSHAGIEFRFSRNAYAGSIETILKLDYSAFPELTGLGDKLTEAVGAGSYGDVPILATELKAGFEALGRDDLAKEAAVVAYKSTIVALGLDQQLFFDPSQKTFVLPSETVAAVKAFQTQNNLYRTGKVDWLTMGSISKEFGTGIAEKIIQLDGVRF